MKAATSRKLSAGHRTVARLVFQVTDSLIGRFCDRMGMHSEWDHGLWFSDDNREVSISPDGHLVADGNFTVGEVALLTAIAALVPAYRTYNADY